MSECVNISNKENETQFIGSVFKTGSKHTKVGFVLFCFKKKKKKKETHAGLNYIDTTKHVQICSEKHLSQTSNRQILRHDNYMDDICLVILQLVQGFVD